MKKKPKDKSNKLTLSKISDATLVRWFEEMDYATKDRIYRASVRKPFVKYKDQKGLKEHRILMQAYYENGSAPKIHQPSIWSWLRAKWRKIWMWRKIARVKNDIRGTKPNPYVTNTIPPKKYMVRRRIK
jgi:hypothetical protein